MDLFDKYGEDELLLYNLKHLPLKSKPWEFTRGRKTLKKYETDSGEIRATKEYQYALSDGDRVSTPIKRIIKWYRTDGTVGLEKEVDLSYSVKDLRKILREIRQGRMDYMEGAGEELANLAPLMPEPYASAFTAAAAAVPVILSHYETEVNHYIKWGTLEFENAVRNETDTNILSLLSLMVRPPDATFSSGLTMKQTILHQLTGEYNP